MDPSSLIFVVIVAIWAAYLLGHWVRRRDQLATARSIDRFSQAMRVLERRTPVAVPLSRPRPRAYVVAPARVSEPQVVAKITPAVARPTTSHPATSHPHPSRSATPRPVASPSVTARHAVASGPTAGRSGTTAAGGRPRAVVLLALAVLAPVAWVLTGLAVAPWWVAVALSVALAAQLVLLRQAAARRRELARRRARLQRRATSQARRQSTRDVVDEVLAARRPTSDTVQEPAGVVEAEPRADAAAQGDVPSNGWSPVPVPPPTYTLKPKAPPLVVRPAAQVPPAQVPPAQVPPAQPAPTTAPVTAPAASAPTFDLDEILERRIASGS